jgi:hypothetical protein
MRLEQPIDGIYTRSRSAGFDKHRLGEYNPLYIKTTRRGGGLVQQTFIRHAAHNG